MLANISERARALLQTEMVMEKMQEWRSGLTVFFYQSVWTQFGPLAPTA